jgi:hypothetical protein
LLLDFNTFLKKLSHALPQRPPVDSIQIGNNSSPLASHAVLYLVPPPFLVISAARPGFRALVRDKGEEDAATGIGHIMHTSATTGWLKSGALYSIRSGRWLFSRMATLKHSATSTLVLIPQLFRRSLIQNLTLS